MVLCEYKYCAEFLAIFLPLAGFFIAGFGGRRLGQKGAELICSFFMLMSLAASFALLDSYVFSGMQNVFPLMTWIDLEGLKVDWALRFDTLSVVMILVVNIVSTMVHVYSAGYMADDPDRPRFFSYLGFFTFAMLMLVTSDNLLQLFFGWEGVGLASYLLIGFWFKKDSANSASMKAFLVNRVGDFGFTLGILGVFFCLGSVNFDTILLPDMVNDGLSFDFFGWQVDALTVSCLLLFM